MTEKRGPRFLPAACCLGVMVHSPSELLVSVLVSPPLQSTSLPES